MAPQIVTEEEREVIDSGRWFVMFSVSVLIVVVEVAVLLASSRVCVVVWKRDIDIFCEFLHKMCSLKL